jgi:dihydroorotate dehydrogenase electron transfer subunit
MTCYADQASALITQVLENELLARDTMRLRFMAPEMAEKVLPGQFFMVRNPATNDPLIGRAFALYDVAADGSGWVDVVYLVKGKLTTSLAKLSPGAPLGVWGPLGNGFAPPQSEHLVMVAGGVGQTPFLALAKQVLGLQTFGPPDRRSAARCRQVTLCYGVRSAAYLAGVEQFRNAGVEVRLATDDGSLGQPRLVTDLLSEVLVEYPNTHVICCGPEPMMEAVARMTRQRDIECHVSLETPMACGIGICFSCVAKVGTESDWDYQRTCVEGPVFNARDIVWH